MKNKLVLIFNVESEVFGVGCCLMFNNALDAEDYLLATGKINKIKIEPDDNFFSFYEGECRGIGKAYWVKDLS